MHKIATVFLGLALAAGTAAALSLGSTATAKPALRLAAKHPLAINGTGFKHRERVTVSAVASGTRNVDRVRANSAGAFTATFENVDYDPCSSELRVRAVGARGSTATLKIPYRECPPKL
jgi:hypothetical protein